MADLDSVDGLQRAIEAIRRDSSSQEAWAEFYRRLRPRVAGVLMRRGVGNREEVKDLCQTVFARFLEYCPWKNSWESLPDAPEMVAYVAVIARNLAFSAYHKVQELSSVNVENLKEVGVQGEIEDFVVSRESYYQAVEGLSKEEFELFNMIVEGYRIPEIANLLEISYSNAGVKVHRLRDKLKKKLDYL